MNLEEVLLKETNGRSLGQSPFTMITKITKTAMFKMILTPFWQKLEFDKLNKSPLYILLGFTPFT